MGIAEYMVPGERVASLSKTWKAEIISIRMRRRAASPYGWVIDKRSSVRIVDNTPQCPVSLPDCIEYNLDGGSNGNVESENINIFRTFKHSTRDYALVFDPRRRRCYSRRLKPLIAVVVISSASCPQRTLCRRRNRGFQTKHPYKNSEYGLMRRTWTPAIHCPIAVGYALHVS